MIELGDLAASRPVPKLKDRRNETNPRHVGGKAVIREQVEGGRMRSRGAWIGLRRIVQIEKAHGNAAPSEQPCREQAHGSAARDQNPPLFVTHTDLIASIEAACTGGGQPWRRSRLFSLNSRPAALRCRSRATIFSHAPDPRAPSRSAKQHEYHRSHRLFRRTSRRLG